MSKAEDYIRENTKALKESNGKEYFMWISPDQAIKAVEIAREEIYEWLKKKLPIYIDYRYRGVGINSEEFINDLKQAMSHE